MAAERRAGGLVACTTMAAAFLAMMDSSIVNVALYSIGADLRAPLSELGMAISGYVLCYGLFLICGGRLGDIYGHRRLFIIGVAGFTAASACCGLAPSAELLIALRCVQGLSAALFFPQVLSIIHTTLHGAERERALGVFGLVIGLAGVVGQVLTGVLVHADVLGLSWRPAFLLNVPIGLAVLAGAIFALPKRTPTAQSEVDFAGAGLLAAGMLLCGYPLAEGRSLGWPPWCFAMLACAIPALAGFWFWERRFASSGRQPLANPVLWRVPGYRPGNAALLTLLGGNAAFFFVMVIQVQGAMGYSPLTAGLLLTPHAIAFGLASLAARRFEALALGCGLNVLGYAIALATTLFGGDGLALIPALVVTGAGQGMSVMPLLSRTLAKVPAEHSGTASGVLETAIQLGISFGITVMALVYFSSGAFAVSMAFSLGLAVVAWLFVPRAWQAPAVTG
ncbi:Predicted arabinose efflux permease, MFS family [Amycolatopsis xylanica]|uniref:Predicted arabinose efflux permease, MFS family n=1 Tax=Amycolatopsis xylanica TaxID=589385 RepID=A0A1H3SCX3_9PSEU|nr:MFS transporter [Amycolatopsis xylanica]SDZ35856.1 Predicted arabinose efflux permease, MFS family [Amycolatopsis xylanica]